ncbi:MAG: hypothetical protein LBC71_04945 [Oscillospiraceae bacterium]|jgi:hypothetical protein|nr:hypothetical protein [Oscillospiraceae bacterium]
MIPGVPEIVKCPSCKACQQRQTLRSGNALGARYYTDGKRYASMLPEYPIFVECPNCEVFFKITYSLCKRSKSGNYGGVEGIPFVSFLSINKLCQAIDKGLYKDGKKYILSLRILLWRKFNDRVRNGGTSLFNGEDKSNDDEVLYKNNCHEILFLIARSVDDENLLMRAELYRNLGEFDQCKEILAQIKEPKQFEGYIYAINKACDNKSTLTYQCT